jgi:Fic family protein
MKKPLPPPADPRAAGDLEPLIRAVHAVGGPLVDGLYLHWDDLRHRKPPEGLSREEWWRALKIFRRSGYVRVPSTDHAGQAFQFALVDPIPEKLHQIDIGAGARVESSVPTIESETRDQYYVRSLMEEAITSSQLEGAVTTRRVAKEMIRSGRKPRNRSEQMIFNNYETMKRLRGLKDQPLTPEMVFELHQFITRETLDEPDAAGRFRRPDEEIVVGEHDGTVYHRPPPAQELAGRMRAMCSFANGETPSAFVHPALRSIILHFWLAYDHPFVDGNGRTARALFYWSMLRHKYWLFEFISISEIILKGPSKYYTAFLHTETDDNDLTYFLLYHLDVIQRSVEALQAYIDRKSREAREIGALMRNATVFNHRQRALLAHAVRHPGHRYSIEGHRVSHGVVYETARADLLTLAKRGLLHKLRVGKTLHFEPVDDLTERLRGTVRGQRARAS